MLFLQQTQKQGKWEEGKIISHLKKKSLTIKCVEHAGVRWHGIVNFSWKSNETISITVLFGTGLGKVWQVILTPKSAPDQKCIAPDFACVVNSVFICVQTRTFNTPLASKAATMAKKSVGLCCVRVKGKLSGPEAFRETDEESGQDPWESHAVFSQDSPSSPRTGTV